MVMSNDPSSKGASKETNSGAAAHDSPSMIRREEAVRAALDASNLKQLANTNSGPTQTAESFNLGASLINGARFCRG